MSDTTLRPELRSFHLEIKAKKDGEKTPENYFNTLQHFENWLQQEGLEIEELEEHHISILVNYLKDDLNFKDLTRRRHTDRLRVFFDHQGRDDLYEEFGDYLPSKQPYFSIQTGREVLYLEIEEYRDIVNACKTDREELIIRTLWETGLRRSELAELTLQRIDRDEQLFRINNKKNDKTRTVPYSAELENILNQWLDYGSRNKYSTASKSEHLIVTQHSTQVQDNYINKIVRRVADRTDVSYVYGTDSQGRELHFPTAHHFRSSYATHRVASGMNLKKVQKLMGHKDIEVTARYVGVKDEDLQKSNEAHRPKLRSQSQELAEDL